MKCLLLLQMTMLTITACAHPLHADEPGSPQATVIRANHLFVGNGDVLSPGAVLILDGKIAQVADVIEAEGATVLSVETLIPGLVDAYSRTGLHEQDAERTEELTPTLETATVVDWLDRGFQEQLASGCTTLALVPGTDNVVAGQSCLVKSAGARERRIMQPSAGVYVSVCNDPTSGNQSRSRPDSIYVRQPTNRMGVVWMLRNAFQKAATDPGASPVLSAVRRGDQALFAVSRTHHDIEALISIADEFDFQPILVGGQEAWRVADQIARHGMSVVLHPTEPGSSRGTERTRVCAETASRLNARDVPFCFSDGDLLNQARFAVRYGLSREAALAAVTQTPAEILDIADRVGSITPGKDADLVALDGDPLQFTSALRWVMVDGDIQFQQDGN